MDYAYIYYPTRAKNLADQLPLVKYLPEYFAEKARAYYPPVQTFIGIQARGSCLKGDAIGCTWPNKKKIMRSVHLAEASQARIIGIDPYLLRGTDLGRLYLDGVETPVAWGDFAALHAALEGTRLALKTKGLLWNKAKFMVLGTDLPLGRLITRILAREVKYLTLAGHQNMVTDKLSAQIMYETGLALKFSKLREENLRETDVVIAASGETFLTVDALAAGTILCDLTGGQIKTRDDIVTIKDPDYVIPEGYEDLKKSPLLFEAIPASLVEVILSCLEGEYELFSHEREMTINQVDKTFGLIKKYGFVVRFPVRSKDLSKALSLDKHGSDLYNSPRA